MTPQEEAIEIFAGAVNSLSSGDDLALILRRCQRACQLLGWLDQRDWFERETTGYGRETPIPTYRHMPATLTWRRKVSNIKVSNINEAIGEVAEGAVYDSASWEREIEHTTFETWWGIPRLLDASQNGYQMLTGEIKKGPSRSARSGPVGLEQIETVRKEGFRAVLAAVERETYRFASENYSFLRYGSAITDIWTTYRTQVDMALQNLGLTSHLNVIQAGIQSDNPEAWRSAMLECRNLLNDVANHLWQDPRATMNICLAAAAVEN